MSTIGQSVHAAADAKPVRIGRSYDVAFSTDEMGVLTCMSSKVVLRSVVGSNVLGAFALRDVAYVDVSPDGEAVVVTCTNGACKILTYPALRPIGTSSGRGIGEGPGAIFAPDPRQYVQCSWKGDLLVRDVEHGEVSIHERDPEVMIDCLASTPDRTIFVYSARGQAHTSILVRRWPFDRNSPEEVLRLVREASRVTALDLDARWRIAVRDREALALWDAARSALLAKRSVGSSGTQEGVAWAPDGAVATTASGSVAVKRVAEFNDGLEEAWTADVPYARAVAYSASGARLAVGSWEQGVIFSRDWVVL